MAWQVDFFVDEHGHAPVEDYLTSLPVQHRAKLLALIKVLEQEGANLPFPYSSQVQGKSQRNQDNAETQRTLRSAKIGFRRGTTY